MCWRSIASCVVVGILVPPVVAQAPRAEPDRLAGLWAQLLEPDAEKAYRAMTQLARTPGETVAFLRETLPAAAGVEAERFQLLIRQLKSDDFKERDAARRELETYDRLALPGLKKALPETSSLEAKRRIEQLIARMEGTLSGQPLRWQRSVELMTWLGQPEAKALLERWAKGAADSRLTQEANKGLAHWSSGDPALAELKPAPRRDHHGDPLSPRAVLRLGTTRWRLGEVTGTLLYAPDGKHLIVVCNTGIALVDVKSGVVTHGKEGRAWAVASARLSPDGRRVIASGRFYGDDDTTSLRVWNLADLKEAPPRLLGGKIEGFADDGKVVLLTTPKGIRHVNLETGAEVRFTNYPDAGMPISADEYRPWLFTGNGKSAVLRGKGKNELLVFELLTPDKTTVLEVPERFPHTVAISPDGKWLAAGSDHDYGLILYDLGAAKPVRHLLRKETRGETVHSLAFAPDGKTLAFCAGYGDPVVVLWDLEHQKLLWKAAGRVESLAFAPDSKFLGANGNHRVFLWDTATGKELTGREDLPAVAARDIIFTRDGRGLLTVGAHELRLWELPSGKLKQSFRHKEVRAAGVSADGRLLATSSFDTDTLRLWDVKTGKVLMSLPGAMRHGTVNELAFSEDGSRLMSWGQDFALRVWNTKSGRLLAEHRPRPEGFPKGVFDDDDERRRRDLDLEDILFASRASGFSADGTKLFWDFTMLRIYDTATGKEVQTLPTETPSGFFGLTTSRDGEWLLIRGDDTRPLLINLRQGKRFGQLDLEDGARADQAVLSADGRSVAVAVNRSSPTVLLYEIATLEKRLTVPVARGHVYRLAFSPDGRHLAGTLDDGTALVWDVRSLVED